MVSLPISCLYRLQLGLRRYLIIFDPLTFVPDRMKCIGQQQLSHQKVICWYLNFTSSTIVLGPSPCFTLQAPVNEKLMETTNYHSRLLDNPMLNHSSKTEDKSPLTMPALSTLICLQLYHTAFTSIATGKERTTSDVAPMYHKPQNGLWTPVKVVS